MEKTDDQFFAELFAELFEMAERKQLTDADLDDMAQREEARRGTD